MICFDICQFYVIVDISESEVNLQKMLDYIHSWCRKWRLRVNTNKSKIMHFRPNRRQRTQFLFKMGNINLDMVTVYRSNPTKLGRWQILGVVVFEHILLIFIFISPP